MAKTNLESKIMKKIENKYGLGADQIKLVIDGDGIAHVKGKVETWDEVVNIGFLIARERKIKNVVNDLEPSIGKVDKRDRSKGKAQGEKIGVIDRVDVVVVGGGVIGCGIARELSRYDVNVALIEKEADVSEGASKANDGMIHPGNAVMPFTLKAKMNIEGNKLYSNWAKDLNFEFQRTGSVILSYFRDDRRSLNIAYIAGRLNRVPKMRLVSGKKAMEIDPSITKEPKIALWTPTTAYVDGFEVTIALAENAAMNGVKFYLETEVCGITTNNRKINAVVTDKGIIECDLVINAAGVYADEVAHMADDRFYTIHPRKGTNLILDKNTKGPRINVALSSKLKSKHSKGGGGMRTVSGNPLWGPSAQETPDKEDISVDKKAFDYSFNIGSQVYTQASKKDVITYFSGIRAPDYKEDFIIEESKKAIGFIHAAAIQSPGLASAPAIAKRVVKLTREFYSRFNKELRIKEDFNPIRHKLVMFNKLSKEEQDKLIMENPKYGNIVCRCETITEGEIIDALHRPLPCTTVVGIKKRTRATAGRCQGGFCSPKIVHIISEELNKDITEVTYKGFDSNIIKKRARHNNKEEEKIYENN